MDITEPVSEELAKMLETCAACRLWPEQDEGPYHREFQPVRRDLVEDREGTSLQLGIRLAWDNREPVHGTAVEVWHCDALGRYSGFSPPGSATGSSAKNGPRAQYLGDETFLRGRQNCDSAGMVEFRTVYPGWYPGRTVHIHVMLRTDDAVLTSQLYFPEKVNKRVLGLPPYVERPGRDTTNETDEIFPTGGDPAVLDVIPSGAGYRAVVCLVVPGAPRHPQ